jgi:hypothetical protein
MDLAKEAGIEWEIVPRTNDVLADIEAVRRHLPLCWFDESRCAQGIHHLEHYRKQWDERNGCYRTQAVHDSASHGADAFRTGVQAKRLHSTTGPAASRPRRHVAPRTAGDRVAGY